MRRVTAVQITPASGDSPLHDDGWRKYMDIQTSDGQSWRVWEKFEDDEEDKVMVSIAMAFGEVMYPHMFPIKSRAYLTTSTWQTCKNHAKAFIAMYNALTQNETKK